MYGDQRRPRSLHPTEDKGINPITIITLKNLASLASVRLRAVANGANPEDDTLQ